MYRDGSLYESAPWSVEAWSRPFESCPLVATRLAGAGNTSTVGSNSVSTPTAHSIFALFVLLLYAAAPFSVFGHFHHFIWLFPPSLSLSLLFTFVYLP